MKITCTKENLGRALSLVGGVTGKNIQLPILSNVLLRATEQKTEIVATNLEMAIVVTVRSKVEAPGSFTVPARTLGEFVGLLPNEPVELEVKGGELLVRCGKSSTKIKGTAADDFPVVPTLEGGEGYAVAADDFRGALERVQVATAKNEIRPELSGVFFGFHAYNHEGLVLAATDSYRLAEKRLPLRQGKEQKNVIVPGRTAAEISRVLTINAEVAGNEDVRLQVGDNQVVVRYGEVELVSRLIEGKYPDYVQIIPKNFSTTLTVGVENLTKEMKAAGLFTTSGVNAVQLVVKGGVGSATISSTSTQTGEYQSELSAEVSGADNTIVLNNRYVLDGLATLTASEAVLEIVSGESPCVLRGKGDTSSLYIIMPIRQ